MEDKMYLTGIGCAVPRNAYTQTECWNGLRHTPVFASLTGRSQALLRKVLLGASGIESRHAAVDSVAEALDIGPDTMIARFRRAAPELAEEAARAALAAAQLQPAQIDTLIIATCTGYLCPGLTSYVSERLALRTTTTLLDLVGLGCGAAIPALRQAV